MLKSNPVLYAIVVLLIAALACGVPAVSTPDPNLIGTAIAQTVAAALTRTAQPLIPITGLGTPTITFTPEPPTLTPTATLSPTPVFTTTPLVPMISVSVATNCRTGPGKVYDRVGALLVGEFAEVVGRDPTGAYWYIRNPDSSSGFCWLWGEYATLAGNYFALPVFTPPPTPTPVPDFDVSFSGVDSCVGWWVELRLENTGGLAFRFMSLTVRDTVTNAVVSVDTNSFTNLNGCQDANTRDTLNPGAKAIVSSPVFAYDPNGHKMRATITLCSGASQSGTCISKVINFKP